MVEKLCDSKEFTIEHIVIGPPDISWSVILPTEKTVVGETAKLTVRIKNNEDKAIRVNAILYEGTTVKDATPEGAREGMLISYPLGAGATKDYHLHYKDMPEYDPIVKVTVCRKW